MRLGASVNQTTKAAPVAGPRLKGTFQPRLPVVRDVKARPVTRLATRREEGLEREHDWRDSAAIVLVVGTAVRRDG